MRKALTALVLVALVGTSGCTLFKSRRTAAEEFAVTRNAPLIIPPDFNLAPPVAGTAGLSAGDAQQKAVDALFGGPALRSPGETSLLKDAGRDVAQVGIRSTAWDPDTRVVDKGPTTLTIIAAPSANSNVATAQ
ncbi:MAG: DUF3035 domain-containing protein [Sphingomicrobium sp.]